MAYVVLRDPRTTGHNHPTYVHVSRDSAEREAQRLATAERGTMFFVCQFVSSAHLPPAPEASIDRFDEGDKSDPWDDDGIPF